MMRRDRILLAVVAVVATLGAFWFVALAPKREELRTVDTQIAAAQQELTDAAQRTEALEAARRSYGADATAVAVLGKAVPADDQIAALLFQLDAAAGQSHVKLKSMTPSSAPAVGGAAPAAAAQPGVTEISLQLSFEGRFPDLRHFLERIHGYTRVRGESVRVRGRLLNVKAVQLSTGSASGGIEATVGATAYVEAPVAPATAPAAGAATPAGEPAAGAPAAPPTQVAAIGAGG